MRQFSRKILSIFISFFLVAQGFFPAFTVHATGGLTFVAKINNSTLSNGGYVLIDPDTSSSQYGMLLDIQAVNLNPLEEAIQNTTFHVDFGNNAGFSYDGTGLKTNIDGSNIISPLPSSIYSSSNGIITSISEVIDPYVGFQLGPVSGPSNIFPTSDIKTYSNNASISIESTTVDTNTYVSSDSFNFTIYANVKPHVTAAYFEKGDGSSTTTQVQGYAAEAVNFVVEVKDSNGLSNIAGGTVIADLSVLGLGPTETLSYVSGAGNTAKFKKTGIVTNVATGQKNIPISSIVATDIDGNQNNRNDAYFSGSDKKNDVSITVITPEAPTVTLESISDNKIGGALELSSVINFHANQDGETKITIGSDSLCESGTILEDWTGSGSYTADTTKTITVLTSSLSEGINTINLCHRNIASLIGSATTTITKKTSLPTISSLTYAPSSVTTGNVSASFSCNNDGEWRIEQGGTTYNNGILIASNTVTSGVITNITIPNGNLSNGSNIFKAYCRDEYGNVSTASNITITKSPATPTITGTSTLSDNDIDLDGLNGHDIFTTWDTSAGIDFGSYFESYRIYLLPSGTSFNKNSQTAIAIVPHSGSGSFTGWASITKDSLSNTLVSGASYTACIAIMGTSGELGTPACSSSVVLTSDTVSHPVITAAKFTSNTTMEVTTNATIDTNLSSHLATGITYTVAGTSYHPSTIASVNGQKIIYTIPSLGSLSATGIITAIDVNSIHASGGGYNNANATLSIPISDRQAPTITNFIKSTAATYGTFYKGNLVLSYSFGEKMAEDGTTKIDIIRTSGNTDSASHFIELTSSADTAIGSHSKTINLDEYSLVSGTTYQIRISGNDLAGNAALNQSITGIGYDSVGPDAPALSSAITTFGTLTPTLAWAAALDNGGYGAGVKSYTLTVYSGNACTPGAVQSYPNIPSSTLSYSLSSSLPTDRSNYSWTLQAVDNMDNAGSVSVCGGFYIDTSVPVISNTSLTDTGINSTSWAKIGNTLTLTANIANSDSAHIWADISLLTGNASDTGVVCSAPSSGVGCNYDGSTVTYSFIVGSVTQNTVRVATLRAQNPGGINETSKSASITVDSTAPSITANTITSPNGGEIWGGTGRTITWNASQITDAGGVASLTLSYSADGGSTWNTIGNTANTGNYTWSLSGLTSGGNYLIKLVATDNVGNISSDQSNAVFSIDLSVPNISISTLTSPNGGETWKGGSTKTISWNTGSISDEISLATNPITLEYSPDNGASWMQIVNGLANSGSYSWVVPSINTSQAKIRIIAIDNAGNTAHDVSDGVFAIDSTNPVLTVTHVGAGGSTPQNGRKLNNSGLDITAGATDTYLQTVSYIFKNITDGTSYVNGSGWLGGNASNILCLDGVIFGTSNTCGTPGAVSITPTIENGKSYSLVVSASDEAGNISNSTTYTYVGDTVVPILTINNSSINGYFSGSIDITGSASDVWSGIGSVTIKIKKGAQYYDGNTWSDYVTELLTTTNNSYANYSYNFTPPIPDVDGSSYEMTITAYDTAYKVANSTTQTFTVNLDRTGPSIASDVFTFDTNILRKGGQTMNISWDPSKITTDGVGFASNPITLLYNLTGSLVTIASNIANNGSYSFTIPNGVDTNAGRIIITAVDALGNSATNTASHSFVVDSTPPSITTVETADFDANGQIDGLILTTSENTNTNGINLSEFTISNGITLSSVSAYNLSNVTKIELHFASNYGDTSSTPTVSYAGTSIMDIAENALVAFSNKASSDSAAPRPLSAIVKDVDVNGKIDTIEVYFSENLSSATDTSAWAIINPLSGVSISSVSLNNSIAIIHFSEPTNSNTSTGGMSISFTANSHYQDLAGNQSASSGSPLSLIDQAVPLMMSATTLDTNANGKVDAIQATFSENISGTDAGWGISGLSSGSSYLGDAVASGNTLTFQLQETSLISDTNLTPALSYTPGNIVDGNGNALTTFISRTAADGVSPVVLSRITRDTDGNGKIDAIEIITSETLSGSVSSVTATVSGHSVYSTSLSGSSIFVYTSESSALDSGETPSVQIVSTGNLEDLHSNTLVASATAATPTDGAGPIISMARYDFGATSGASDDIVYVTFSEPINTSSLAVSDFVIQNTGALGSATLSNVTSTSAEIHLASDSTALIPNASTISLTTNSVTDTIENGSPTEEVNNRVVVLPPVIINEIMWSSYGSNASQYIELHNLGSSSIDISGWKIKNAGGNGSDLIIPGGTSISGGAYYLIARNTPATNGSVLDSGVSTDLVSTSLSLATSQNAIILENAGGLVFDSAKATPWSAGSDIPPVSMERNSIAGNGLLDANWHHAVVNRNTFSLNGALGTPGAANEIDGTAPTLALSGTQNAMFGNLSNDITYTVSDNYGINWNTPSITLERWNGSSWSATGSIAISTGSTTVLHTSVGGYGKYRSTFYLTDTSGNTAIAQYVFYVDIPVIEFSTGSVNIGNISSNGLSSSTPITVTIKTVGAGVSVSGDGDAAMALSGAALEYLGAWNGSNGYGIDYSISTPSGSGNIIATGTPKALNTSIFSNTTVAPDENGNLQTYTIQLSFLGKPEEVTPAGIYKAISGLKFDFNY